MNNKIFYNNNNKKMRELCSNNHAKAPKTVSKPAPKCALIQAHDTATEVIAAGAIPFTVTDYMSCTSTIKLVDNVFQMAECGTYIVNYCVQVVESAEYQKAKVELEKSVAKAGEAVNAAKKSVDAITAAQTAAYNAGGNALGTPVKGKATEAAEAATDAANKATTAARDAPNTPQEELKAATDAARNARSAANQANNAASLLDRAITQATTAAAAATTAALAANTAVQTAQSAASGTAAAGAANSAAVDAAKSLTDAETAKTAITTANGSLGSTVDNTYNVWRSTVQTADNVDLVVGNIANVQLARLYALSAQGRASEARNFASAARTAANNSSIQDAINAANIALGSATATAAAAQKALDALLASETASAVQLFIYIPNCCQHSACPTPNPITSTNWTPIEYSRKSITGKGSIRGTYQIEIKNRCALIGLFNVGAGVLTLDQDKLPNTCINIFRVCSGCCEAV